MRIGLICLFSILSIVAFGDRPLSAQKKPADEPLVDQVKRAINNGISFLRQNQTSSGSWQEPETLIRFEGGSTCLAMLALLNAGVDLKDPMMVKGMEQVRKVRSNQTYVVALQTMVLAEVGQAIDKELIKKNVDWLIAARQMENGQLRGWSYYDQYSPTTDNSNTQYALLGLLAGRQAGIEIPDDVWKSIRDYYVRTQEDGGWRYSQRSSPNQTGPTLTMTTAGLCGLIIAGMELNKGREVLVPGKRTQNCGVYEENEPVKKAIEWVTRHFRVELPLNTFYNLYGIERAGRLSGLRFFGNHDWYREGCLYLVKQQHPNGSWSRSSTHIHDQWPVVSTSFALLFLSKGRTPVLMSKLVHGQWPRGADDLDWNNDRNATKHLTEFASKNLFKRLPLAWQVFDIAQAVSAENSAVTEELYLDVTSELLQSPIVFINGHKSPRLRLTRDEKEILKRFVENGGFILAEACCGDPQFDQGFRELVQEIWPDNKLEDLPADHPIWRAHFPVPPGSFKLKGLHVGCKTVLVYSPEDMSCYWEANQSESGEGQLAFRMGANIIAYATGLEPPQPRLQEVEIANIRDDLRTIPRGYLKVGQLKHAGDWQPAPRAMPNLMSHLRKYAGMNVSLQTELLPVYHENLIDFKFLYLHGRGSFSFADGDLKELRFNLENGGLLLADACCGSESFDSSFRKFMKQLFPAHELKRVPADDVLFSKDLNGVALTEENTRLRRERGGELKPAAPFLEGIQIDNRWVVLYSKYDLGCALERHQSSDCLGYDPESALRIASAAVLYLMRP